MTWCHFDVSVDSNESINYESMFSMVGTAERSVGVSEAKFPAELENRTMWQPCVEPWDCEFYFYYSALPNT